MSRPPDREPPTEFDPANAAFPSDRISVESLRAAFPDQFDRRDLIENGYTSCNFFYPTASERPEHLVRLTEMLCDERTVAAGAFLRTFDATALDDDDLCIIAESLARLEKSYQLFKLADGPATAQVLIRQVEAAGRGQAVGRPGQGI